MPETKTKRREIKTNTTIRVSPSCQVLTQIRSMWKISRWEDTWKQLKAVTDAAEKTKHGVKLFSMTSNKNVFLIKTKNGDYLGMIEVNEETTRAVLEAGINFLISRKGRRSLNGLCCGCQLSNKKDCTIKKIAHLL